MVVLQSGQSSINDSPELRLSEQRENTNPAKIIFTDFLIVLIFKN
ncbi:hypothetical protein A33Q_0904 [Indibacter alkaliphilus LW1]|uniref:Uncharacterized protein n=1 Tax=Indibacter alkaliphilus (strain CCUG 57479 / KCTC 22604 / LW1) TaxID=1189612 RepID=S2E345_INDAL|nr:hypothetical protein A33Q_0904 [Indibacter alkaliphilus LW1]